MKRILGVAALTVMLTVGVTGVANATPSNANIALSNGQTLNAQTNWSCGVFGEVPTSVGFNAPQTYTVIFDQAVNGTLIHREYHTATSGSWPYAGLTRSSATDDMNITVKTGGLNGTKVGSKRVPGC